MEQESRKLKDYLLKIGLEYEKHGFLVRAEKMFRGIDNKKADEVLLRLARRAEENKLYALAAEYYGTLNNKKKARKMWENMLKQLKADKAPPELIKEAAERLKPEAKEYQRRRMFAQKATNLEREGKFEESKKIWEKSARCEEGEGNFEFAAKLYSNACLLEDAKRVWQKVRSPHFRKKRYRPGK